MKNNYFIIHGAYGNPYKNWIPRIRNEITKRTYNCNVPHFPTPVGQEYKTWEKILNCYKEVGYINESTSFVTHSLGGVFIVKYCVLNNIKINKKITVAGFNNVKFEKDLDIYNSFYESNEVLSKFKELCKKRYCIYSNDDTYVPKEKAEEFSKTIDAIAVEMKNMGHFSFTEFKELIDYIK